MCAKLFPFARVSPPGLLPASYTEVKLRHGQREARICLSLVIAAGVVDASALEQHANRVLKKLLHLIRSCRGIGNTGVRAVTQSEVQVPGGFHVMLCVQARTSALIHCARLSVCSHGSVVVAAVQCNLQVQGWRCTVKCLLL